MNSIGTKCLLLRSRFINCKRSIFMTLDRFKKEKGDDIKTTGGEKSRPRRARKRQRLRLEDIVEPTNCCMSGCANCVWIQYAEKLSNALTESDVDVQKVIMEKVQDPNMKAFLMMELRTRNLIKS